MFSRKFINLTQLKSHCDLLGPFSPIHNLFSALEVDPFKDILRNVYAETAVGLLSPHHNFPSLIFPHRLPSLMGVSLKPGPFSLPQAGLTDKPGLLSIVASAYLFTY